LYPDKKNIWIILLCDAALIYQPQHIKQTIHLAQLNQIHSATALKCFSPRPVLQCRTAIE